MRWWAWWVVLVSYCGGQWVEKPEDVAERLGGSATFNCSAGRDAGSVVWMKMDATGTATVLFYNTESWINSTRIRAVDMPEGGTSLTLTSLERADDARYKCTIQNSLSHTVTLTVLVNPGTPELDSDTAEQGMREGVTVEWTCTSSGGNPAPTVTWYRNRSPVNDSLSTLAPPGVKFGATVASLTWTLTADDHLANLSCSASTAIIAGSRVYSPVASYRVQYAPIILLTSTAVGAVDESPLIVVDNSTLSLSCDVDAYPPVNASDISWYKDADFAGPCENSPTVCRLFNWNELLLNLIAALFVVLIN